MFLRNSYKTFLSNHVKTYKMLQNEPNSIMQASVKHYRMENNNIIFQTLHTDKSSESQENIKKQILEQFLNKRLCHSVKIFLNPSQVSVLKHFSSLIPKFIHKRKIWIFPKCMSVDILNKPISITIHRLIQKLKKLRNKSIRKDMQYHFYLIRLISFD